MSGIRYVVAFLITIGLIVLIFVLLLRGTGTNPSRQQLDLASYASNPASRAQLIIDGPEVSQQEHQGVTIDVTQADVTFTVYQGYEQTAINALTFANNQPGYAVFLLALKHADFTKGNSNKDVSDERGYCPSGTRYVMSFYDGNDQLLRYWKTSCGNGTFRGNLNTVLFMFRGHVPNYYRLTNGVRL